jgi:hypothetical protein
VNFLDEIENKLTKKSQGITSPVAVCTITDCSSDEFAAGHDQ